MAEIGIAGAIGDFVADRLAQRHPVPEIQLGRLVQRVGIGTVGFDVKRPVLAGDFGDLPALLGDNPLAIEEVESHMAAGAGHVIGEQIARNHVVFGGTEVIVVRCGYRHCHGYLLKDPFRWSAGRKAADAARVKLFSSESSNLYFHSFVVLCVSACEAWDNAAPGWQTREDAAPRHDINLLNSPPRLEILRASINSMTADLSGLRRRSDLVDTRSA
ncbi:hypothetical protein RHECNPAF_4310028 [Rhizobium etli CNPAF512]|nr:hypothetical protein RHECNPAF_4310028 [Rhizobium etli CNPAF512]